MIDSILVNETELFMRHPTEAAQKVTGVDKSRGHIGRAHKRAQAE